MRYFWQFSAISVACLVLTGCAARYSQPPRETITFDYAPEREAPPGSADVTFGIVGVQFVITSTTQPSMSPQQNMILPPEPPPPLFLQLVNNMTRDFEEILTARGYGIKGSFQTLDEMIYPDKEGSDLILTAKIKFKADTSGFRYKKDTTTALYAGCGCAIPVTILLLASNNDEQGSALLAGVGFAALSIGGMAMVLPDKFVPAGQVSVSSEIDLEAYEALTNELMWSKKIPIPPFTVAPKAVLSQNLGRVSWQQLMKVDNGFYSDLGSAFEVQYDKILDQIHTYLDPREMEIVKNQAMELRKRKVY